MKTFTGQKKVIVVNFSVIIYEVALQQYKTNTKTIQLRYKLTKTKRQMVAYRAYSCTTNSQTKIPVMFCGIFRIFAIFQNFFFILGCLVEQTHNNIGKHYTKVMNEKNCR
jgi:hypothetical protein